MKIGLVIKLDEDQALGRAPRYSEIRTTALAAEESGFDSIWLYDHLLFRNEGPTAGIWECWTTLSALAEATKRVELGTLVMCNAFRARSADLWNTAWLGQPKELAERLAKLHAACEEVGRDPATLAVTVGPRRFSPTWARPIPGPPTRSQVPPRRSQKP